MNLQDIVNLVYKRLDDEKGPDSIRGHQQWELVAYANLAEREIARRLELLKDSDTIGYINLYGATVGQIDSISVSTVTATSAAVPFATNAATTAVNLAANINAYTSTPNYRAVARGTLVIIKAISQTGFPTTGYTLAATVSGGMTATATNLPGLCRHVVAISQRHITLHEKIVKITRFKPYSQTKPIALCTKEAMDANYPDWETEDDGEIKYGIPDYENNEAILYPSSDAVEAIEQDIIRLPLIDLSVSDLTALPEIKAVHHEKMIEKILELCYRKNDVETLDLNRSQTHRAEFERLIGEWEWEIIKRDIQSPINQLPNGLM